MTCNILIGFLLAITASSILLATVEGRVLKNEESYQKLEEDSYCFAEDNNPYTLFGTKSAYELVRGNLDESELPEACEPVKIWAVYRHGTRYPKKSEIKAFKKLKDTLEDVQKNYKKGRGTLCTEDYELLTSWQWDSSINKTIAKQLAPQGFEDLKGIAKRFKQKYPSLFDDDYSEDVFYFQHSTSDRTRDSLRGYLSGLFSNTADVNAVESDEIIKEYKACDAWNDLVEKTSEVEYLKFIKTDEYKEVIEKVSERLGFKKNIDQALVETIFKNCAFEKAWYVNEQSKWCTAFDKEDLQVLEYSEDLLQYYEGGYGIADYNAQLGCPLVADLYTKFENIVTGNADETKVVALFTHSSSLQQFQVSLGLFQDDQTLTGENYENQKGRKWRTSLMSPFATNIAAVLYRCDGGNSFKVQLYLDEEPLEISEECTRGLCSWETFKNLYQRTPESCNLSFCNN